MNDVFRIAYSSYIPVDHATTSGLGCTYQGHTVSYIYMGDANRGTSRTSESITMIPDASTASGFYPSTGQTRQYAYGSPANGSTLSQLDEDNVAGDCYLFNGADTASPAGFTHSETYSTNQGQELFIGSAGNPLEKLAGPITWNMRSVIDTATPASPTAYVNYNHTCYPAHQVFVNGSPVYLYIPTSNNVVYIGTCLAGIGKIVGQTIPVNVPAF